MSHEVLTLFSQGGFALLAIGLLWWQLRWFMLTLIGHMSRIAEILASLKESVDAQRSEIAEIKTWMEDVVRISTRR
ncbi:MAG: hypothetical protein V2G41_09935 [bacterium JZ-2024 1]